ncbi:MAG: DUF58 domain-containing protein, partial [Microbacterium sp.]
MYVTGRLALLVGAGIAPIVLLSAVGANAWAVFGAWLTLCAALAGADAALAADPRLLRVERSIPRRARLGERVDTALWLANDGARRLRGLVRDAWQPTAGAPEARMPVDLPPGERRRVDVPLLPRRRGERTTAFVV